MAGGNAGLSKLVNRVHTCGCLRFLKILPENSIDFCMTSPPYWKLRDYGRPGQIGQEKTPEEYIEKLVIIFREFKRVLKDTGSLYLNLGDTYIGTDNCRANSWKKPKQLALLPSRVAIALQEDGWILRNDICWFKPNGLPSSVKDRLTCRWEHVFHFVKQRKYYYNLDAIREPFKASTIKRIRNRVKLHERTGRPFTAKSKYFTADHSQLSSNGFLSGKSLGGFLNLKGGNPGDFWAISVKPVSMSHFAVYPEELCIRPIKSSCPPGGIVFDMFSGSGTTLVVAKKLGRRFVGSDINRGYVRIARKRLKVI
jgi:site-specific DNA-methyltransferase (cytosine-N4-specific)